MRIIRNAVIYTLEPSLPTASALAVENGRILGIGGDHQIMAEFGERAKPENIYHAGGRTVIPGLIDAHIHLAYYASGLQKVDCETKTRQECLRRVAERAQNTHPGEWVLGHGWNQNEWPEGFGSAVDLDAIAPHNPVFLTHKSLHSSWVNSAALRLAGITVNTPDPDGGHIGRKADGAPDGILFESASDLVESLLPAPSVGALAENIRKAIPILLSMGLTGLHDFDGPECFEALQLLQQEGELRLRVIKGVRLEVLPHAIRVGLRGGFGDDFLRLGPVKAFSDGALGPQTAAMIQPYEDTTDARGMLLMDAEELFEHGRKAAANGFSMAVHAIGDLANHEVLNAFEQLRRLETRDASLPKGLRHRIEHVQLLHPDDVARLAELKVIASMQPIHATSDMHAADRHWGTRAALSYAWRSQLEHKAVLAFGSDAPVESPNPFWGLHAAVTRRRQDGSPSEAGWYPEQRLTVEEALRGFTCGPAYAAGMENRLGRLAPGCLADLLVLDADPFACPHDELYSIRPVRTMVNGDWVWTS